MTERIVTLFGPDYQAFFNNSDAFKRDCENITFPTNTKFVVYWDGILLYAGCDQNEATAVYEDIRKDGKCMYHEIADGEIAEKSRL
jgi:hypothetical protein